MEYHHFKVWLRLTRGSPRAGSQWRTMGPVPVAHAASCATVSPSRRPAQWSLDDSCERRRGRLHALQSFRRVIGRSNLR